MTSEVTFIGLGSLGSALAAFAQKGEVQTRVWNRTATKAEPLVRLGARAAASVEEALGASALIVICVTDYEASNSILMPNAEVLRGRTVVQLTTGSAKTARESHRRLGEAGVMSYLDGAFMGYPSGIGADHVIILVSGDRPGFQVAEPLLRMLAPSTRYLGEDPGLASTLDQAQLLAVVAALVQGDRFWFWINEVGDDHPYR